MQKDCQNHCSQTNARLLCAIGQFLGTTWYRDRRDIAHGECSWSPACSPLPATSHDSYRSVWTTPPWLVPPPPVLFGLDSIPDRVHSRYLCPPTPFPFERFFLHSNTAQLHRLDQETLVVFSKACPNPRRAVFHLPQITRTSSSYLIFSSLPSNTPSPTPSISTTPAFLRPSRRLWY